MPRMHLPRASSSGGFWSIERVVALLTPAFSAGAGWLTSIIANNIPGVSLPSGWLAGLFATGATAAAAAALKWLHGRQKFVNFTTDAEQFAHTVAAHVQALGLNPLLAQIGLQLHQHEAAIIDALGNKLGASASAEDIAKQIVQELWPHRAEAVAGATAS